MAIYPMLLTGDPLHPVGADLSLTTADGEEFEGELAVRRFTLSERIDEPFRLVVELVTDDLAFDVESLIGARGSMPIVREGHSARVLHGVVTRSEYVATRSKQLFLRLTIESSLSMLRYSRRRRIFSDQTLLQVLEAVAAPVFETFGGVWFVERLHREYAPRDYVVQYDETDLEFALRLLGESGVSLVSADGGDHEALVLVDTTAGLPGLGASALAPGKLVPVMVPLVPSQQEEANAESVQYVGVEHAVRTRGARVVARDWKTPGATSFHTELEAPERGRWGSVWEYHPVRIDEGKGTEGPHFDSTDARVYRYGEEHHADGLKVSGSSNLSGLSAGSTFELTGHPYVECDLCYAVVRVEHEADFPEVEVAPTENSKATYTNTFVAQLLDENIAVRPLLPTRPSVLGPQTAVVVGPPGEEVHTDALGRVRVRFHWDVGDTAEGKTCWLRVVQSWAGSGFGASFIPRVGMEVVVSFLGGDPDRPIVTGCVYTGTNQPPGSLPETKTCTTLRTRSTPGGEGFNELRFEDSAGHEEVFMHAQRNHREVVRSCQRTSVGASRSLSVGKDSKRSIGGSETVQVGTPNAEEPGNFDVFVTGSEMHSVGELHTLDMTSAHWTAGEAVVAHAGKTMWLSCSDPSKTEERSALDRRPSAGALVELLPKSVSIEAPESITLKVGGTSLQLTPRGIFLEGPVVSADAKEQVLLSAKAGRLGLTQESAWVYGGEGGESSIELTSQALDAKSTGLLKHSGKAVMVTGRELVNIEAPDSNLVGFNTAVVKGGVVGMSGTKVGVHGKSLVDVVGGLIKLNS